VCWFSLTRVVGVFVRFSCASLHIGNLPPVVSLIAADAANAHRSKQNIFSYFCIGIFYLGFYTFKVNLTCGRRLAGVPRFFKGVSISPLPRL
jgi:hypothetical protein